MKLIIDTIFIAKCDHPECHFEAFLYSYFISLSNKIRGTLDSNGGIGVKDFTCRSFHDIYFKSIRKGVFLYANETIEALGVRNQVKFARLITRFTLFTSLDTCPSEIIVKELKEFYKIKNVDDEQNNLFAFGFKHKVFKEMWKQYEEKVNPGQYIGGGSKEVCRDFKVH